MGVHAFDPAVLETALRTPRTEEFESWRAEVEQTLAGVRSGVDVSAERWDLGALRSAVDALSRFARGSTVAGDGRREVIERIVDDLQAVVARLASATTEDGEARAARTPDIDGAARRTRDLLARFPKAAAYLAR